MSVVLVVEDNADLRQVIANLLHCVGHEVRSAGSAEEGLADILRGGLDVVITDWMLGDATGGVMLQHAHAAGALANVGIVIHSSSPRAIRPAVLPDAVLIPKSTSLAGEPSDHRRRGEPG
jgi:CheY-like chemotaxis protein